MNLDITEYVCKAEQLGHYKDNELKNVLNAIKKFYHLDHMIFEAGVENWAFVSNYNGVLCMIHTNLKLIFTNLPDLSFLDTEFITLHFENYSDKVWSIDLSVLKLQESRLHWHTNEIECNHFSTQELYYATV